MTAQARLSGAWEASMPPRPELEELSPESCSALEKDGGDSLPLSALWSDLVSNRYRVQDCLFSETRCFLVLSAVPRASRPDRRLDVRKVRVLERILLGEGQKAVALSLRVAPSTVTLMSGECLRAMGLDCRTSRVPMPLVMAAHSARDLTDYRHGTVTDCFVRGVPLRVIGMPRPDVDVPAQLSRAEREVARLLVEGKRHAEIALIRDTSTRTIANQLASAFQKLDVSGRAELLCGLIRRPSAEGIRSAPLSPLPVGRSVHRRRVHLRGAVSAVRLLDA